MNTGKPVELEKRHLLDFIKDEVNGKDIKYSRPKYRIKYANKGKYCINYLD
jgi:hypothetical protein